MDNELATKSFLKEILSEHRSEFERYVSIGFGEIRNEIKEVRIELKREISSLRRDMVESFVDLGEVIRGIGSRQEDHEDRICILEKA